MLVAYKMDFYNLILYGKKKYSDHYWPNPASPTVGTVGLEQAKTLSKI